MELFTQMLLIKKRRYCAIMEITTKMRSFTEKLFKIIKSILNFIGKCLKNETFLYIVKRVSMFLVTLLLIISVITALLRLMPDISLYDVGLYNRLKGSSLTAAENYRIVELFKYGRYDLDGNRTSVFYSIAQYIYWVLPIPKQVPIVWDTRYTVVLKYFEGWSYLGRSMDTNKFVADMLKERVAISFNISIISIVFIYMFGYPLGVAMAKKPGGLADKFGNIFLVLNYAIPALVFFLIANKVLGNPTGIFGSMNFGYFYEEEKWWTLVPPIFSIVFLSIPGISIWVRRFMVDELSSDYVKFARSKGLSENRIMYTHVLKNASVPLVRNLPAVFIGAIIGSYFTEVIWGIPGTGNLLISALRNTSPDVPVIQGLTVIYALMSMTAFLLGDIVTVLFDPRIKLTAKGGI